MSESNSVFAIKQEAGLIRRWEYSLRCTRKRAGQETSDGCQLHESNL